MTREITIGQRLWQIAGSIAIIIYTIVPLLWIVNLSLKPGSERADGNFWPVHPTLEKAPGICSCPRCSTPRWSRSSRRSSL